MGLAPLGAAEPEPAAGMLLIASRGLGDPNFARSVVLLTHVSEQGAVGVIVNRRSELPAADLLPEVEALVGRDDVLYRGGPVARGRLLALAASDHPPAGVMPVSGDLYLLSELAGLSEEFAREQPRVRLFAGHAGWAPGQLEHEIERGGWHLLPSQDEWIFSRRPETLWQRLIDIVFLPVA